jgi:hypothetical protein
MPGILLLTAIVPTWPWLQAHEGRVHVMMLMHAYRMGSILRSFGDHLAAGLRWTGGD